jgi:hypothetical protein
MVNSTLFRAAVLLAGGSIIAAAVAIHPVSANGAHPMGKSKKPVTCNTNLPCISANNTSAGSAIEAANNGTGIALLAGSVNSDGVQGGTFSPSKTSSPHAGVSGYDNSTDGGNLDYGVYGQSVNGSGVAGTSANYVAVFGQSTNSVSLSGTGVTGNETTSIQGIGGTNNDVAGLTLATFQRNGTASFWVDNDGNAYVYGQLIQCDFSCPSGDGIGSYAAQSSTPTLEDVGAGRLVNGSARVAFDAPLSRAIDRSSTYAVFVSPEGPNRGLYVTDKTAAGFTVAENPGGRDTIPFSYRLVARRSGVAEARRLPTVPHVPKPVFARVQRPRGHHQ